LGNKVVLYSEIYEELYIRHKLYVITSVNFSYYTISVLKNTLSCVFIMLFTNL